MECLNFTTNVLVALIGFGITALLGINIWYSFNTGNRIKKRVADGLATLREENRKLGEDAINHTTATLHLITARQFSDLKHYDLALLFYLKGVEAITKITNCTSEISDICDQCLDNSLGLMKLHAEDILNSGTIYNTRKVIEDILIRTEDKRSNDLYTLLLPVFNKP